MASAVSFQPLIPADVARRKLALRDVGVEIALQDWGGDGPLALLHHANGFCAAMLAPVAEALRERFHVVAMDARGHGDSSLPPEGAAAEAFAWPSLCRDLREVAHALLAETGERRIALGLGHSFGGTLTLAAAGSEPGLYERLLLVDPVILPPMTAAAAAARAEERGLAKRSRKRRHDWPCRRAARAFFAERKLFQSWTPRALDLYVAEGLRERSDGRVELKCPGAVEARIFEAAHTLDIFALAAGVEAPVRILWASRGDFPRAIYEALCRSMQRASIEDVAAGHLIPMEQPEQVTRAALAFCDEPLEPAERG